MTQVTRAPGRTDSAKTRRHLASNAFRNASVDCSSFIPRFYSDTMLYALPSPSSYAPAIPRQRETTMKRAYDERIDLPCPSCGEEGLVVFHPSKRKHPTTSCTVCGWRIETPLIRLKAQLRANWYGA